MAQVYHIWRGRQKNGGGVSELKELCRCIDKDSPSWVKDTGRKMKNKDEVSWMYKRGFPSSFGGSMRMCAENK